MGVQYIIGGLNNNDGSGFAGEIVTEEHGAMTGIETNMAAECVFQFIADYDTPITLIETMETYGCKGIGQVFQHCRLLTNVVLQDCTDLTESDFLQLFELPCIKSITLFHNSTIIGDLPPDLVSTCEELFVMMFTALNGAARKRIAKCCPNL